jgi:transposase
MKILQTKHHYSDEDLKKMIESQSEIRAFKDWQIIYAVQTNRGKKAEEIAKILNTTKSKVLRVIQQYNKHGKDWRIYGKWGGRRNERCHLPLEEETSLMHSLEKDALSGKILTFKHIRQTVEEKVGKTVSEDYIWDLFKRHGWSKKVPRQYHPKRNIKLQEDYKKNFVRHWHPNH